MNHTMKEIPESQRPYEKCIREGESTLSDGELLAVILRCGTRGMNSLTLANDILSHMEQSPYPGLLGLLHCSVSDLKKIHGIGTVKAVQLKCIGELSKRIASTAARISLDFNSPDSIAAYYMEQLRHQEQEIMICMMLDNQKSSARRYHAVKRNRKCNADHTAGSISGSTSIPCGQSDIDS